MNSSDPLEQAREAFINQWGAMGSRGPGTPTQQQSGRFNSTHLA